MDLSVLLFEVCKTVLSLLTCKNGEDDASYAINGSATTLLEASIVDAVLGEINATNGNDL